MYVITATYFSYAYITTTRLKIGPCTIKVQNTIQDTEAVVTRLHLYCISFYRFLIQGPTPSLMMATYVQPKHVTFYKYDKSCV